MDTPALHFGVARHVARTVPYSSGLHPISTRFHKLPGDIGLHADTLYRLCRTGQFSPAIQIGGSWRVSAPAWSDTSTAKIHIRESRTDHLLRIHFGSGRLFSTGKFVERSGDLGQRYDAARSVPVPRLLRIPPEHGRVE